MPFVRNSKMSDYGKSIEVMTGKLKWIAAHEVDVIYKRAWVIFKIHMAVRKMHG